MAMDYFSIFHAVSLNLFSLNDADKKNSYLITFFVTRTFSDWFQKVFSKKMWTANRLQRLYWTFLGGVVELVRLLVIQKTHFKEIISKGNDSFEWQVATLIRAWSNWFLKYHMMLQREVLSVGRKVYLWRHTPSSTI